MSFSLNISSPRDDHYAVPERLDVGESFHELPRAPVHDDVLEVNDDAYADVAHGMSFDLPLDFARDDLMAQAKELVSEAPHETSLLSALMAIQKNMPTLEGNPPLIITSPSREKRAQASPTTSEEVVQDIPVSKPLVVAQSEDLSHHLVQSREKQAVAATSSFEDVPVVKLPVVAQSEELSHHFDIVPLQFRGKRIEDGEKRLELIGYFGHVNKSGKFILYPMREYTILQSTNENFSDFTFVCSYLQEGSIIEKEVPKQVVHGHIQLEFPEGIFGAAGSPFTLKMINAREHKTYSCTALILKTKAEIEERKSFLNKFKDSFSLEQHRDRLLAADREYYTDFFERDSLLGAVFGLSFPLPAIVASSSSSLSAPSVAPSSCPDLMTALSSSSSSSLSPSSSTAPKARAQHKTAQVFKEIADSFQTLGDEIHLLDVVPFTFRSTTTAREKRITLLGYFALTHKPALSDDGGSVIFYAGSEYIVVKSKDEDFSQLSFSFIDRAQTVERVVKKELVAGHLKLIAPFEAGGEGSLRVTDDCSHETYTYDMSVSGRSVNLKQKYNFISKFHNQYSLATNKESLFAIDRDYYEPFFDREYFLKEDGNSRTGRFQCHHLRVSIGDIVGRCNFAFRASELKKFEQGEAFSGSKMLKLLRRTLRDRKNLKKKPSHS